MPQNNVNRGQYHLIGADRESAGLGIRHLQTLLVFFGLTCAYGMRVNLSVAIVAMTDRNSSNPDFEDFDWNESTQSLVLSSFFWGYVITQIPGGQLAERYGAKVMLMVAISVCSILNILTPIGVSWGEWKVLCAFRVVQGFSQGVIFPSTHALLSKWSPLNERGKLGTFCYSGANFGTVVMLSTSGLLAESAAGWPSIFYVSGGAGILWSILWFIYGGSSPSEYHSISEDEKLLIENSLGYDDHNDEDKPQTPWKSILTSVPFLALLIVQCGDTWGFWTLLTEMPRYMKNILGLNIKQNALLSSLPYAAKWILSIFLGCFGEIFVKRGIIGLGVSRRIFNTIGDWIPMVALIVLGYVTKDETKLAVVLLTVAVGINSATYLGYQMNHIDLSPNFAGTLMGIANCAANIMSIIAPLLVGLVVTDNTNPLQWRIVFFIAAGIYFGGNLLFILLGKFKVQSWNLRRIQLDENQCERERSQ